MSDKPRRFWQIHLSTLVIVVVSTAAMATANSIPSIHAVRPSGVIFKYGWPVKVVSRFEELDRAPSWMIRVALKDKFQLWETVESTRFMIIGIVVNALTWVTIMVISVACIEYLMRSRSRP